jgi:hypothetical protein
VVVSSRSSSPQNGMTPQNSVTLMPVVYIQSVSE